MKLSQSPKHVIALGAIFAVLCMMISTTLAINTPWLGVSLEPDDEGLRVTAIQPRSPADGLLQAGDIIASLYSHSEHRFDLHKLDIMEDPYDLALYREYRDFFSRQSALHEVLTHDSVQLILADGRELAVSPQELRPLRALPVLFWFQLLCGAISLLISFGVYAFRQQETSTTCFALSGIGFMVITAAAAMYSSRELAIDGNLFYALSLANQYGTVLLVGVGTAVLCYYPRRVSPLPMGAIFFAIYALFALLHTLEVWETLNVGIRLPIALFCVLNVTMASLQWRLSRQRPVSRAALKWLLYSWFSCILLFLGLRLIPVSLGMEPFIPQAAAWLVVLIIYAGIALGITRYRLFNLDRWVLKAWFWIFGGLAVIGLDLALLTFLDLNSPLAAAISLAVVGWIYFPLRQLLWHRFAMGLNRADFESLLPDILNTVLTPNPSADLSRKWRDFVQKIYQPMEIQELTHPQHKVEIVRDGICLRLPGLPGGAGLELSGAERARRLFNLNDIRFSQAVWNLFKRAFEFRQAFAQGAHEERQRIARDLHDDVAARLLTLVHRSEDPGHEKLARQTLSALRETIYTLGTQTPPPLEDLLSDMRYEIQERLEAVDIHFRWQVEGSPEGITLTPRQHINLQRILQELTSNVIHHAEANTLQFTFDITAQRLKVMVCDNGMGGDQEQWVLGKGLNNIRNRAEELHGKVEWRPADAPGTGCCATLSFPLSQQDGAP
jgi:signal transduction histidine kinase